MRGLVLLAGVASVFAACSARDAQTLGAPVEGTALSVAALQQSEVGSRVVLRGVMTQKCPVAGCWFMLRDDTGTIRVDTKNAGFVVVDVPLQAPVTVGGRVTTHGAERVVDASCLRY
jgi:uncharacterized protein YdeI (BOF family)